MTVRHTKFDQSDVAGSGYQPSAPSGLIVPPSGGTAVTESRCAWMSKTWPADANAPTDDTCYAVYWLDRHVGANMFPLMTGLPEPMLIWGKEWLVRARAHLAKRFDAELTGKRQRITTEQAALAMLKGASLELEAAGKALDTAAEQLRDAGQGKQASQAKQAASQAKAAAGELVPS